MNKEYLVNRINSFRELKYDWDSYCGSPISNLAIQKALDLIDKIPLNIEPVFAAPGGDGSICIEIGTGFKNPFLILDITDNNCDILLSAGYFDHNDIFRETVFLQIEDVVDFIKQNFGCGM